METTPNSSYKADGKAFGQQAKKGRWREIRDALEKLCGIIWSRRDWALSKHQQDKRSRAPALFKRHTLTMPDALPGLLPFYTSAYKGDHPSLLLLFSPFPNWI